MCGRGLGYFVLFDLCETDFRLQEVHMLLFSNQYKPSRKHDFLMDLFFADELGYKLVQASSQKQWIQRILEIEF